MGSLSSPAILELVCCWKTRLKREGHHSRLRCVCVCFFSCAVNETPAIAAGKRERAEFSALLCERAISSRQRTRALLSSEAVHAMREAPAPSRLSLDRLASGESSSPVQLPIVCNEVGRADSASPRVMMMRHCITFGGGGALPLCVHWTRADKARLALREATRRRWQVAVVGWLENARRRRPVPLALL